MPTPIIIPSLGESITEVMLGQWLVKNGQWVERDQSLVEVESDKVTQELPSPISGILTIAKQTGEECTIDDTIGSIDETADKPIQEDEQLEATKEVTSETIASAQQTKKATPLAQKVATDLGVSLENIDGSGPSGRITKSDVIRADDSSSTATPALLVEQPQLHHRNIRREKMSTLRKRIAQRLVNAQHSAAMLTTFNEVDMSNVITLRKIHKDEFKALCPSLQKHAFLHSMHGRL